MCTIKPNVNKRQTTNAGSKNEVVLKIKLSKAPKMLEYVHGEVIVGGRGTHESS